MANYVVDSIADETDGNTSAGHMSLREAVALANATGGADTISFAGGLAGQTITLSLGQLALTQDVTIDGDSTGDDKADIAISGNNASRIFSITGAGTDVTLLSLTLTGGNAGANNGGAIEEAGAGFLQIYDTTIENSAAGIGGGIYVVSGACALTNSTIAGNSASTEGGGVAVLSGTLSLEQTTVDGNASAGGGGGIAAAVSHLYLVSSTVAGNRSDSDHTGGGYGGGIDISGGITKLFNTVVAGNIKDSGIPSADDVHGTIGSADNSVFGTAVSITTNNASLTNAGDVHLAALADNGGTVETRGIMAGSVLIDAGNDSYAGDFTYDANGHPRITGSHVDVGATEVGFLTVNTTSDEVVPDDGLLSLREAIDLANASSDLTVIKFAAELSGQSIMLTGGSLSPTEDIVIDGDINGDHKADITIDGIGNSYRSMLRMLNYSGTATTDVTLQSLTLTNSTVGIEAGHIASINIIDTTMKNFGPSGGITGFASGGAMRVEFSTLSLTNSLITDNHVGASSSVSTSVLYARGSSITMTNTTVDGNICTPAKYGAAAILLNYSSLTLLDSTVTRNVGGGYAGTGGAIYKTGDSSLVIVNSVVANNYERGGVASDISGAVNSATNSVFGTNVVVNSGSGNLLNIADVALGELLDNGGTVLTRSPLDGSVLIGAGSNAGLPLDIHDIDHDGDFAEFLPRDGRGGVRVVAGTLDVGAVEQIVNETINGTALGNLIIGGNGNDILNGLGGDDIVNGGKGADAMDGGDGSGDWLSYADSRLGVTVNLGTGAATGGDATGDSFFFFENLLGSGKADNLTGDGQANLIAGGDGGDTLDGGGGDDTLEGGRGGDTLNGGNGSGDTVSYAGSIKGVNVNLATGAGGGGDAAGDVVSNIENIVGSGKGDHLTGNGAANQIDGGTGGDTADGGDGDDNIKGGNGDDRLIGGGGIDTLDGGKNSDTFVLSVGAANHDNIFKFVSADDTLEISAAKFGGGLVAGAPLDPSQFASNTTGLAGDADDRFILNTATGDLFFDSNGSAAGGSRLIAHFTGTLPTLTADDFAVV